MRPSIRRTVAGGGLLFLAALAHTWLSRPALAETRELPVPSVTIYTGDTIGVATVVGRLFNVTATSTVGFATDKSQLIGKQARRRLVAGRPIPLNSVAAPSAIKQGAVVAARYEEAGFSILSSMIALQDGSVGDVIEARNSASGLVVRAVVQPDGSLLVGEQ